MGAEKIVWDGAAFAELERAYRRRESENELLRRRCAELERANRDLQASNDRMLERSHKIAAALQDELDNVKEN